MDITLTSLEKAHTELLSQKIMAEIASKGGWIPFSRYMEMALYEPGMGYYSAGAHKLGAGGDFTTAPELSSLFGAAIVETLLPILEGLQAQGLPTQILEFGAGTGKLAESILTRLHDLGFSLDRYDIIEISPDLAQRQEDRLQQLTGKLALPTQCNWLSSLPSKFKGVVLANEVIDAIPCDAIISQNGFWYQQGVAVIDGKLAWSTGKPVEQSLLPEALLTGNFSEGYVTELHVPANAWMHHVAKHLDTGLFLTFDYGFPESEYYHAQRLEGTLMAHHRHHAIQDPFHLPGLCDLTTHVEWSQIARSALEEGVDDVYLSNQASYLLDAGIGDIALEIGNPSNPETFLPISNSLQKILSEAEMGELFKVFAFSKKLSDVLPNHVLEDLPGFRGRNRL
ncbi:MULTISPECIES: SAM-dependent methyltransferase [unclassified Polynucleobacter]|jgi:SAM-dependent MidA family methyltransferase|uniref:class I SAM-dependent methyltransferase n=1 Tax=unclassified Polynucleobacter TaxID=2640945 RepID=UPI000BC4D3A4|nr:MULTISPECIES: SAM-dependent methyltransferase [unclassified Polynucleobacter]OYY21814.1 MAG: SAM-dependent methyltransferase [Polynucleobacter sp. 35-46-11]OZA78536.1 MAG: SAM-dependent methyltransferase [Polynucleobacter sp. 39-46-10]